MRVQLAIGALAALAATVVVSGQNQALFRASVDFVTTDVIVRKDGKFVPGLREDEFAVYEDDVPQTITLFEPRIGGRSLGNLATAASKRTGPVREGLVLPSARPTGADSSGRLFMILIDDLHLQPSNTLLTRDVLRRVRDTLVQDNDLVGFASSGRSSIALDPAYDPGHRRFNEVIGRIVGSAATPDEIVQDANAENAAGPPGLRFNAHVAFKTAFDLIDQMSAISDRRKVFLLVSNGYTFNPFADARLQQVKDAYANSEFFTGNVDVNDDASVTKYQDRESLRTGEYNKRSVFSHADLVNELAQVERAAQRANVTFYPIDPRGQLVTGDLRNRSRISDNDWRDLFQTQIMSLKVLAEGTGGFCICEMNDFDGLLRRIDAETSDYYRIGYTSNNPDPRRVRRIIRIEVARPGLEAPIYRREYTVLQPRR
jgi:VWFA-related protein